MHLSPYILSIMIHEVQVTTPGKHTESEAVRKKEGPPIPKVEELPKDGQIVFLGDRLTFTFAHGTEVGSIHFDKARGEIFYKGHNIRNIDPEPWQWQVMEELRKRLSSDGAGNDQLKLFAETYGRVLDKVIIERRQRSYLSSF